MIWAVSPDQPEVLAETAGAQGFTFPLLHDPEAATIERFGVLRGGGKRMAHPTAVVVDEEGVIRYWRIDENYRERPSSAELLAALDALPPRSKAPASVAPDTRTP